MPQILQAMRVSEETGRRFWKICFTYPLRRIHELEARKVIRDAKMGTRVARDSNGERLGTGIIASAVGAARS